MQQYSVNCMLNVIILIAVHVVYCIYTEYCFQCSAWLCALSTCTVYLHGQRRHCLTCDGIYNYILCSLLAVCVVCIYIYNLFDCHIYINTNTNINKNMDLLIKSFVELPILKQSIVQKTMEIEVGCSSCADHSKKSMNEFVF